MAKKRCTDPVWHDDTGQSRLVLGNALDFMEQLPANCTDCIWTDPPYRLSNDGTTCVAGKRVTVNKGRWDRSRGPDLDHESNRRWIAACHRILKPSGTIWVSGTLHVYLSVGMAMQQLGFRILNDIVWEKPAPPPESRLPVLHPFDRNPSVGDQGEEGQQGPVHVQLSGNEG